MKYPDKSPLIILLRRLGQLLPGNYLKTTVYLNLIHKPRKILRRLLNSFYRMDIIYEVIQEFKNQYKGKFSILEFGTADGYSFTKMLYATKYLDMDDRITVHTFDSFEGMPDSVDAKDKDIIADDGWVKGQFKGRYQELEDYCRSHYQNYHIHKGYFQDTLTDVCLSTLETNLPILVWIDCDYYSSTRIVFDKLIPYLPNGCVIYFDDYDFNFGSRFTGEARIVYEINQGVLGEGIELILDRELSLNSNRVYRFMRFESDLHFERLYKRNLASQLRQRTNDSPMP
ncbi:MAG: TylF/MycF/NovP-related O-methyltransferase [Coleofasciculus sp. B1-GNL1-01]|uniref:TylF/MycF/NovP-related O-methyltransferase n=1 Tax=Coleofasciculus sp. B1-GNL1-01 TaxID=3068484 RepID=UPI0032F3B4E0